MWTELEDGTDTNFLINHINKMYKTLIAHLIQKFKQTKVIYNCLYIFNNIKADIYTISWFFWVYTIKGLAEFTRPDVSKIKQLINSRLRQLCWLRLSSGIFSAVLKNTANCLRYLSFFAKTVACMVACCLGWAMHGICNFICFGVLTTAASHQTNNLSTAQVCNISQFVVYSLWFAVV